jgi:hypothetical protein
MCMMIILCISVMCTSDRTKLAQAPSPPSPAPLTHALTHDNPCESTRPRPRRRVMLHARVHVCAGFMGILLGDVLFRSLVIQFDLTHPTVPIIGLGQRNTAYRPVRCVCVWVLRGELGGPKPQSPNPKP